MGQVSVVILCLVVALAGLGRAGVLGRLPSQKPLHALGQGLEKVPQYVLDYAPVIYLYSEELYFPADLANHLNHSQPRVSYCPLKDAPDRLDLDNLGKINSLGGENITLDALDDFTKSPSWIRGTVPNADGKTEGATSSVVIVNDKGDGIVDAFYIFFYGYNQGNRFLELTPYLGNHLGDWEHIMIRYRHGFPQKVFYSQHDSGTVYTFRAVEKYGSRIVGYAGNGTHATWASPGTHWHILPYAILDFTDKGYFWDPLKNAFFYSVSYRQQIPAGSDSDNEEEPVFTALPDPYASDASSYLASTLNPHIESSAAPTDWLYFLGRWGNEWLPESDPRQTRFFLGIAWSYTSGPRGPIAKDLNRESMCKNQSWRWLPCIVWEWR